MRISGRLPEVGVEYECRGKRSVKWFADAYAARRFYALTFKQGKAPKVVGRAAATTAPAPANA
jgi:hypothetical protein